MSLERLEATGPDREGMSDGEIPVHDTEVEAVMGPPPRRLVRGQAVCHAHTDQFAVVSDYERRWLLFGRDGRVTQTIPEYWVD